MENVLTRSTTFHTQNITTIQTSVNECEGHQHPTELSGTNEAIAAIIGIFFALGSTGNLITMLVIAKNKSLHNPSNFFIFSLCISDLISGVVCSPLWLYRRTYGFKEWKWGDELCKFYWSADFTTNFVTALHILSFALFRCFAVHWPFRMSLITTKRVFIYICVLWAIAIVMSLPLIGIMGVVEERGNQDYHPFWPSCSVDLHQTASNQDSDEEDGLECCVQQYNTYMLVTSCIFFYVPEVCIIIMSCLIARTLLRRRRWRRQISNVSTVSQSKPGKLSPSKGSFPDVFRDDAQVDGPITKPRNKRKPRRPSFHNRKAHSVTNPSLKRTPKESLGQQRYRALHERKTFTQLSLIVISFMIGYVPFTVYPIWTSATTNSDNMACGDTDYWFGVVSYLCLRLSECINPIVYNLGSSNIRKATKDLFRGVISKCFSK